MTADPLPIPSDFPAAHHQLGAMCGHGAFAAAMGIQVMEACEFFPELDEGIAWVAPQGMENAMDRFRRRQLQGDLQPLVRRVHFKREGWLIFARGLYCLQWEGSWLNPEVRWSVRCTYRHWVASRVAEGREYIYDVNAGRFIPYADWLAGLPSIYPKRCTGWHVFRSYEITL